MFIHWTCSFCLLCNALGANALYDIFGFLHTEPLWQVNKWDGVVLKAVGLAALEASEVDVIEVVLFILAAAHTVLLLPCAIIDVVQQMMLHKEAQCTKDAGAVHVRHSLLHVGQRECLFLLGTLLPHQNPDRRGLHAMFL